jgi:hypothetical protein
MNFLDRNPVELAQLDHLVDLELEAEREAECGSRLTQFRQPAKVCRLPAGHGGVCGWALAPAGEAKGER